MTLDATPSVRAATVSGTVCIAVVFTLYVAVAFGFGLYLFAVVVTSMREELGLHYAAIGLVTGGAQVSYLVAALLCPVVVDRFGGGRVIVCAVVVSAALLCLFGGVETVTQVGLVLAGLGAAAAWMVIPTVGVISRVVPFAYRSRVNGLVSSGTAYGQFVNGIVVPRVLPDHGWRSVWLAIGLAAFGVAGIGFVALRAFAREAFDRDAAPEPLKAKPSGVKGKLLTGQHLTVWLLFALNGAACGPWQNYLASFLADERKWSVATIGQIWSIIGLVGLFSGFAAGMAADTLGIRRVLAASYATLTASALLVALHHGDWPLRAAAVCFGLSFYAVYGLIPAYIAKTSDPRSATAVFAIANVFLGAGTTLGNVVGGYAPALSGTLQSVFFAASATAVLAMALTLVLRDERSPALMHTGQ